MAQSRSRAAAIRFRGDCSGPGGEGESKRRSRSASQTCRPPGGWPFSTPGLVFENGRMLCRRSLACQMGIMSSGRIPDEEGSHTTGTRRVLHREPLTETRTGNSTMKGIKPHETGTAHRHYAIERASRNRTSRVTRTSHRYRDLERASRNATSPVIQPPRVPRQPARSERSGRGLARQRFAPSNAPGNRTLVVPVNPQCASASGGGLRRRAASAPAA